MYLAFFMWMFVKYILMMNNICDAVCTYLDIKFMKNKPAVRASEKGKLKKKN